MTFPLEMMAASRALVGHKSQGLKYNSDDGEWPSSIALM